MNKKQKIESNPPWIVSQLCKLENSNWAVQGMALVNELYLYYTLGASVLWKVSTDKMNEPSPVLIVVESSLHGIVWDGKDKIYICDSKTHRILSYSILSDDKRDSKYSLVAGIDMKRGYKDGNIANALFCSPREITMDKNGDLLITEDFQVRKIYLTAGTVETVAGRSASLDSTGGGYRDGQANQAIFRWLFGIAVSDDGTIYVSDGCNSCIRQIKDGMVTTLCGRPSDPGYTNGALSKSSFTLPSELFLQRDGSLVVYERGFAVRTINIRTDNVSTRKPPGIQNAARILVVDDETLFMASTVIEKIRSTWKWERYLWIGRLREDSSYCHLSGLPKDVINEIVRHLRCMIQKDCQYK